MAFNLDTFLSVLLKSGIGLFIFTLIVFAVKNYMNRRKYFYEAEVYEKDNSGNVTCSFDKFGIQVDKKTNKEMGWLKSCKDAIGLDGLSYQNVKGKKGYTKIVRLMKISEGSYTFLNPKINDTTYNLTTSREDVDWAINTYIRWTKVLENKDKMKAIMSYMLIGLAIMIVFIVLVMLIKHVPTLASTLTESAKAMEQSSASVLEAVKLSRGII